ncbi:biliverdin-producing heme oxygenase [Ktedonosporobacter rubrisoli]|uniref:Biliverdin-producing heme oxygenase n=1 Tax=Ktedonosporobacter rubrisoli TaxID=2509675 RepID=A0A4P6K0J1_KTERU|nr:biliverdin-producing heme oxygenase [Ktedonosporobacter rubrisoli]QBD81554.1 biliverdin-producing heme oxygenase [Ktedonosporobacter rubrisoli]
MSAQNSGQLVKPITELIVDATRAQHEKLDERTTGYLTREGLDLLAYRRLLESYYGFYKPLDAVYEHIEQLDGWQEVNLSLAERKKSQWLEKDLRILGDSQDVIDALPRYQGETYQVTSIPQALGLLYVVEGSTLGGQYLARIVEDALHIDKDSGSAFFRSYGPQNAHTMWKAFCQQLCAYAERHPEQTQSIIDSALAVYAVANQRLVVHDHNA